MCVILKELCGEWANSVLGNTAAKTRNANAMDKAT